MNGRTTKCPPCGLKPTSSKNMGEEEVADYADAIVKNCVDSLMETFGRDLYKDGTANTAGAATIDGLAAICTHNSNPALATTATLTGPLRLVLSLATPAMPGGMPRLQPVTLALSPAGWVRSTSLTLPLSSTCGR